jgi:ATP-binding cassette subfamily C (CFTR/MRP) protein 4
LSHLVTSVRGMTTIRALNAQKCLQQEFDHHQDVHSSVYYLLQATISTFTFWVDMICVLYTAIIVFSYLLFETRKSTFNVFEI